MLFRVRFFVIIGLVTSYSLAIDVHIDPTNKQSIEAVQGEPAILPCRTKLAKPVVWMFRGFDGVKELSNSGLIINGFSKYFQLDTKSDGDFNLVIKSANSSNAGLYTCDEEDGIGQRHEIQLSVADPYPKVLNAKLGGDFTLPCHLTSLQSTVNWRYGNQRLVEGPKYSISSTNIGVCHLVVRNVEASDAGEYRCIEIDGLTEIRSHTRLLDVSGILPTTPATGQSTLTKNNLTCIDAEGHSRIYIITTAGLGALSFILICVIVITARLYIHRQGAATVNGNISKQPSKINLRYQQSKVNLCPRDTLIATFDKYNALYKVCAAEMVKHIIEHLDDSTSQSVDAVIGLDEGNNIPSDYLANMIANRLGAKFIPVKELVSPSEQDVQDTRTGLLKQEPQEQQDEIIAAGCAAGQKVIIVGIAGAGGTIRQAVDVAKQRDLTVLRKICLIKSPTADRFEDSEADWTMFDFCRGFPDTPHAC